MSNPELDDLLPDLEGYDEQYARELLERTHQIGQLTQHPGWSIYCDYLIALTTSSQTRIVEGYVETMEEYRTLVGRIRGIREALQAPDKLASQVRQLREQARGDDEEVEFDRGR